MAAFHRRGPAAHDFRESYLIFDDLGENYTAAAKAFEEGDPLDAGDAVMKERVDSRLGEIETHMVL